MKKHSKFMSLILRHDPAAGDLTLDAEGWAKVTDVLAALRAKVGPISRTELDELVATNDKQRFSFNDRGDKIRANQGHSLRTVDLKLVAQTPPPVLYHGTKQRFVGLILADGLRPMKRQHVHLSPTLDTALAVAGRRSGDDVIFAVDTSAVEGEFYQSANGVWLTAFVPATALSFHVQADY